MIRLLIILTISSICFLKSKAQRLPEPINSKDQEISAAMLPDSSILVARGTIDNYEVKRFVYNGIEWVSSPNQLTTLINSVIYHDSHVHFRFSNDFTKMILMLHGKNEHHIYLTEQQPTGEWSLFRDIIDPGDYSYFNFTPSFSYDNSVLYLSDNAKKSNIIWRYTDTKDFSKKTEHIFDEFGGILDVIGIDNQSVLVLGALKSEKHMRWFYLKQLVNGQWSVPYGVKSIDQEPFALSITPFNDIMLYASWEEGDLYLMETPDIVKTALTAIQNRSPAESIQIVAERNQEPLENKSNIVKPNGSYHALLIGNSNYQDDALDLEKPHEDIIKLKSVLENNYSFDTDNIVVLENASREVIFSTLYQLRTQLTTNDNLLIFYAGHGFWDEQVAQGYWWPVDADKDNPSNWLSNSDLREQIRGINSAHTLLISDACFSGGIFKTRGGEDIRKASTDIKLLYRMPSRRAITSGTLSTVPDNSVFFNYLIKYLEDNERDFLPASELFTQVRRSVLNNSLTVPQDGVIMDTGDEGGDFIFIRKDRK